MHTCPDCGKELLYDAELRTWECEDHGYFDAVESDPLDRDYEAHADLYIQEIVCKNS